jgi:DNA modification methylase
MDTNVIYCGDNLEILPRYIPNESIDLIYIDPPFNTSRQYEVFWGEAQERRAFQDRFGDAMTYLEWMRPRIRETHRVLKPMGSFYYHCDWHASHYIKIELDRVFGFGNFIGEIVWQRTSAHPSAQRFANTHDSIFFYSKSPTFTWNPVYQEANQAYVDSHYIYVDSRGKYRAADLTGAGISSGASGHEWHGFNPSAKGRHWAYVPETLNKMDSEGLIHWPTKQGGWPAKKVYWDESKGKRPVHSVWTDIAPVNSQAEERLGYPTQKPLALLERIIQASSNDGDLVLDIFCGCGTTLEAAAKLKRKWIGIDFSPTACRVMAERLEKRLGLRESIDFALKDMPRTADQLRSMPPFEFQNWAVVALGGIPNKVKVADYGIDGRLYLADMAKEEKAVMQISEKAAQGMFETLDKWYPIQVKQVDKVGRPDIDKFETAMRRDKRLKGYFVAFGFSGDATREIKRAQTGEGLEITPITVEELLEYEKTALT